jgi:hypothetical protein
MEERLEILFNEQFFNGISDNPVHQAMLLPLPSIKLAHLSSSEDNRNNAINGLLEKICFSDAEQKKFAYMQIAANNYLKCKGHVPLPLLHLTPRMLLPFEKPPVIDCVNTFTVDCSHSKLETSNAGLKRSRRKKKKGGEELQTGTSLVSSSVYPNIHSVLERMPPESKNLIGEICNLYERELLNIREHYENVIQSLNLRLYIAQDDIEQMKSIVNKTPSDNSIILQLIEKNVNA